MVNRFRIYYGDGSTYSGDPFTAPRTNVQVIAQESPNARGFDLTHGDRDKGEFYWDGKWWQLCNSAGLYDYLMSFSGPQSVIFGRTIRDEDFFKLLHRASEEGLG